MDLRDITSLRGILVAEQWDGDASRLVRSTDGLAWLPVGAAGSGLTILGSGRGRVFATDQATLWASTNGIEWQKMPGFPPTIGSQDAYIEECYRMAETADGLAMICEGRDDVGSFPVALDSSDGDTWSATTPWGLGTNLVPAYATIRAIGGGAIVQFPDPDHASDTANLAPTYETDIAGVLGGWTKTDEPPVALGRAATAGDVVVAVGAGTGSPDPQVWIGTLEGAGPMLEETAGASPPIAPVGGVPGAGTPLASPSRSWSLTRVDGPTTFGSIADWIDLAAVTAAPDGRFLVLGRRAGEIVPWTSPDGSRWTRGMPFARTSGEYSAGGPPPVLAAGGRRGFIAFNAGDAPAWLSEDGLRWRPVRDPGLAGVFVRAVIATDDGFVAVGIAVDAPGGAIALSSRDGVGWTRATIESGADASAVVRVPGGFVAAGSIDSGDGINQLTVAWTSPDGRVWSRGPGDPSKMSSEPFTSLLQVGSPTSVLGFSSLGTWSSSDGRSWQSVPGAPTGVSDAFALGNAVVAVGPREEVFVSDEGRAWHPIEHGPSTVFWSGASNGERAVLIATPTTDAATGIRHNDVWVLAPPLEPVASAVCPPDAPTAAQYIELSPVDRLACYGTRRITISAWVRGREGTPGLAVSRNGQPLLVPSYPSALEVPFEAATGRSATVTLRSGQACPPEDNADDGGEPISPYEPAVQAQLDCRLTTWLVDLR